jgi:hypothetical protein
MTMLKENTEYDDLSGKEKAGEGITADAEEATPVTRKARFRIKEFIDGTVLVREDTRKQLPFVIFLTFLGIVYIGNRFYTERLVRQINEMKAEVGNLRSEQITIASELMNLSRPSEVADMMKEKNLGLYESLEPPKKLVRK